MITIIFISILIFIIIKVLITMCKINLKKIAWERGSFIYLILFSNFLDFYFGFIFISDRLQILLLIFSEFKRINWLIFLLKPWKNLRNRSWLIRLNSLNDSLTFPFYLAQSLKYVLKSDIAEIAEIHLKFLSRIIHAPIIVSGNQSKRYHN